MLNNQIVKKNALEKFLLGIALCLVPLSARAQEALSPEVNRMIEYLMLADDAGLDVPLYIMELSDQPGRPAGRVRQQHGCRLPLPADRPRARYELIIQAFGFSRGMGYLCV